MSPPADAYIAQYMGSLSSATDGNLTINNSGSLYLTGKDSSVYVGESHYAVPAYYVNNLVSSAIANTQTALSSVISETNTNFTSIQTDLNNINETIENEF